MNTSESILSTWSRAASDLEFQFISPIVLLDGEIEITCFAHLPQFGSSKGVIVFTEFDDNHCKLAQLQGFAYSCIVEQAEQYDRNAFIDMLNDWGWSDSNREPPAWYTGKPWSR